MAGPATARMTRKLLDMSMPHIAPGGPPGRSNLASNAGPFSDASDPSDPSVSGSPQSVAKDPAQITALVAERVAGVRREGRGREVRRRSSIRTRNRSNSSGSNAPVSRSMMVIASSWESAPR